MAVWLQPKRVEAGADDILYYQDGLISECPRSNFFLVTADNRILTPAAHVLKGITRKKLIELAEKEFVVEERDISLDDMHSAKEAFITSTTRQVLPVRQIDSITYPQTAVSLHLRQRFLLTYLEKQQPV
jgi:D-alanine transaminase/branched-chain amino acid aminotransferase